MSNIKVSTAILSALLLTGAGQLAALPSKEAELRLPGITSSVVIFVLEMQF